MCDAASDIGKRMQPLVSEEFENRKHERLAAGDGHWNFNSCSSFGRLFEGHHNGVEDVVFRQHSQLHL
jgi:hypothetical protein